MTSAGRPVIGKKKDCDIRVRVDSDLYDKLVKYCVENGITRAEAIRQAIEWFLKG